MSIGKGSELKAVDSLLLHTTRKKPAGHITQSIMSLNTNKLDNKTRSQARDYIAPHLRSKVDSRILPSAKNVTATGLSSQRKVGGSKLTGTSNYVPPHLRGKINARSVTEGSVATSESSSKEKVDNIQSSAVKEYIPPHLRRKAIVQSAPTADNSDGSIPPDLYSETDFQRTQPAQHRVSDMAQVLPPAIQGGIAKTSETCCNFQLVPDAYVPPHLPKTIQTEINVATDNKGPQHLRSGSITIDSSIESRPIVDVHLTSGGNVPCSAIGNGQIDSHNISLTAPQILPLDNIVATSSLDAEPAGCVSNAALHSSTKLSSKLFQPPKSTEDLKHGPAYVMFDPDK
jgi:hypothetical protein